MNPAEKILRVLDQHLVVPVEIRLLGGAALALGYGLDRSTEDADLLLTDEELTLLAEEQGFGEALEATNRELEPLGLYLSHIWGPEQIILTPSWRESCRPILHPSGLAHVRASVLGPLDLLVSKLCRADEGDLEDVRFLIRREQLNPAAVRAALQAAMVPFLFADSYGAACQKVEALLTERS